MILQDTIADTRQIGTLPNLLNKLIWMSSVGLAARHSVGHADVIHLNRQDYISICKSDNTTSISDTARLGTTPKTSPCNWSSLEVERSTQSQLPTWQISVKYFSTVLICSTAAKQTLPSLSARRKGSCTCDKIWCQLATMAGCKFFIQCPKVPSNIWSQISPELVQAFPPLRPWTWTCACQCSLEKKTQRKVWSLITLYPTCEKPPSPPPWTR